MFFFCFWIYGITIRTAMQKAIRNCVVWFQWCRTLAYANGNIKTQTSINCQRYCVINTATDAILIEMRHWLRISDTIQIALIWKCKGSIRNIPTSSLICVPSIGMNTFTIICRALKSIFLKKNQRQTRSARNSTRDYKFYICCWNRPFVCY